jgi:hypothetical protein
MREFNIVIENDIISLNDLTLTDLVALADAVAEIKKAKKEEFKAAKKEATLAEQTALDIANRAIVNRTGIKVLCIYKGEDVVGEVVNISEKSVTVALSCIDGTPIINDKGKQVKTWKHFHQVTPVTVETPVMA